MGFLMHARHEQVLLPKLPVTISVNKEGYRTTINVRSKNRLQGAWQKNDLPKHDCKSET